MAQIYTKIHRNLFNFFDNLQGTFRPVFNFCITKKEGLRLSYSTFCQQNAYPAETADPSPRPTLHECCSVGVRNDPSLLFFGLGEEGGDGGGGEPVFVVASAFKSVILKLDMRTPIFLNVFVQDCSLFPTGCDL